MNKTTSELLNHSYDTIKELQDLFFYTSARFVESPRVLAELVEDLDKAVQPLRKLLKDACQKASEHYTDKLDDEA